MIRQAGSGQPRSLYHTSKRRKNRKKKRGKRETAKARLAFRSRAPFHAASEPALLGSFPVSLTARKNFISASGKKGGKFFDQLFETTAVPHRKGSANAAVREAPGRWSRPEPIARRSVHGALLGGPLPPSPPISSGSTFPSKTVNPLIERFPEKCRPLSGPIPPYKRRRACKKKPGEAGALFVCNKWRTTLSVKYP